MGVSDWTKSTHTHSAYKVSYASNERRNWHDKLLVESDNLEKNCVISKNAGTGSIRLPPSLDWKSRWEMFLRILWPDPSFTLFSTMCIWNANIAALNTRLNFTFVIKSPLCSKTLFSNGQKQKLCILLTVRGRCFEIMSSHHTRFKRPLRESIC